MRIDRLLWFLRFAKTRGSAQKWVLQGHIRRNTIRIERACQLIGPGDTLTLPLEKAVLVIEILALPKRRGPACEARKCYRVLDDRRDFAIAQNETLLPVRGNRP